ncbi:unnamed protein product [Cladocopium goreaui]|uniref:Uncharacterized protein n=1 Tax=Cladocopium goreaui TaxID=2562237 RepID=A0A9P1D500_9DINO|nr:unnamed protein product [Cladocopium goreaui]
MRSSVPTAVAPGALQLERHSEKTEAPEFSPVEVANVIKVSLKLSEFCTVVVVLFLDRVGRVYCVGSFGGAQFVFPIRCLMSVSVDIPGHGNFDIKLTASSTAADIILLLRERLPDSPWHGNKLLSSGVCQLQCDDIVEATHHGTLVLTNYSEITNQEAFCIKDTAERGITREQLAKIVVFISKMADRWRDGYAKKGCSMVEIMAIQVQSKVAVARGTQLERRSQTEASECPVEVITGIKVIFMKNSLRRLECPALRNEFRESPRVQVASASNPNRCILPATLPEDATSDLPAVVLEECGFAASMSVSVDIPGHGCFDIKLTASITAADIILLLRERLPDSPWHGNKLLSSGVCQLQCDDIVEATHHSTLVLTNYSEITNQEAFRIEDTAERGITREQLAKIVVFISKMADRWCDGYAKKGCSMVEIMAIQVQRPQWFVSHAWSEPVCKFLACLEQHALVRELSSSTFYWVCAYANNQHSVDEDIKKNPRSTSFYRAMQMSEGVLLVLDSAGRSKVAVARGAQLERRSHTEASECPVEVITGIKVFSRSLHEKLTAAAGRMPSTTRLTSFESRGVRSSAIKWLWFFSLTVWAVFTALVLLEVLPNLIRCLMSDSVDIPGHGHFDIKLTASSTAADIILLLRERLPDSPWHGNKLLSSGVCQLQCDDIVEATRHSTLVLTNYSEITNQEAFCIKDTAERGITREQLAKIVVFISKMADRWCDGYAKKGCSMVELMAIQVQRPHWFVSHAWIEPVCKFLACLEQHALVRELSSSTFYWVCAYANNQHCVEEDIKSNPRSTSFYRAMQMSEGVLLVLDSAGTSSVPAAVAPGALQLERRAEKTEAPEFSLVEVANVIKEKLTAAARMPSTARLTSFESRGVRPPVQVASASNPHRSSAKWLWFFSLTVWAVFTALVLLEVLPNLIRCLMSVSVDIPGHGHFDIKLTASSTAADIILLLRERLPDSPWHGNKLLSSGVCQLQCDDIVEATRHSTLVLTNYSEITNQEPFCIEDTAERGITREQLAKIEPVCKFLACLEQHALVRELSSSTFYWVCAYANNQHCVEEDIKSNPRSTSFYRAMQMSEGVLLVSEGCLSYADADDPGYCRRGLLQFWLAAAADVAAGELGSCYWMMRRFHGMARCVHLTAALLQATSALAEVWFGDACALYLVQHVGGSVAHTDHDLAFGYVSSAYGARKLPPALLLGTLSWTRRNAGLPSWTARQDVELDATSLSHYVGTELLEGSFRIRCLMSVSVDIPGHGYFDIKLTASRTAADIILLLRERLPDSPWHGNKLLSSGVCQLQCDDIVEATHHGTLVLTNYSEITNQEAFCIKDTAERGITREQLAKIVVFISKMADRWCETFGEQRGTRLQFETFNLYQANHWIIKPATEAWIC